MTSSRRPETGAIMPFASARQWETWLAKHHKTSDGLWIKLYKKGADTPSVTYAEALDVALCYGWIDSQKQACDAHAWLQRFTPRRARSGWSKKNVHHAERLIAAGRMKAAGMKEVEAAQADGRWTAAYDSATTMTFPEEFLAALRKDTRAREHFETLNRTNRYAIAYRLQTAKTDATRARRLAVILEKLRKREMWH